MGTLKLVLGIALTVPSAWAQAPALTGHWESPKGSVVRVYGCGPAFCLRLVKLEPGAHPLDTSNPKPELRARALCGLEIGTGFAKSSELEAKGGSLYDPDSGKTYSGSMRVEGAVLKLRGSWGPFWRTEDWKRYPATVAGCGG